MLENNVHCLTSNNAPFYYLFHFWFLQLNVTNNASAVDFAVCSIVVAFWVSNLLSFYIGFLYKVLSGAMVERCRTKALQTARIAPADFGCSYKFIFDGIPVHQVSSVSYHTRFLNSKKIINQCEYVYRIKSPINFYEEYSCGDMCYQSCLQLDDAGLKFYSFGFPLE